MLSQARLLSMAPASFVLLWSTGFVCAKLGLPYAGPVTFLLWRFGLVVVLMAGLAWLAHAPWPTWAQAKHVALAGVLLQAGYLGGVFSAIALGLPSGVTALIVCTQPLLTALAGPLIGERVTPRQWAGLLLGVVGVALVVGEKLMAQSASTAHWLATGLAVMGLVSMTAGTLYQKKFCGQNDLRTQSVVQFMAAFAVLLPFGLAFESLQVRWSPAFVAALGWAVLVLSLGAISLLLVLIKRGAATSVSSLFYLVPPVSALLGWLMFDERLGWLALCGFGVTVIAVAMVMQPVDSRKLS
jgi:drug/metabolite transporter (DMT)-like permease